MGPPWLMKWSLSAVVLVSSRSRSRITRSLLIMLPLPETGFSCMSKYRHPSMFQNWSRK